MKKMIDMPCADGVCTSAKVCSFNYELLIYFKRLFFWRDILRDLKLKVVTFHFST